MKDWKEYKQDIKPNIVWICIFMFGLLYIAGKAIFPLISDYLVRYVLSRFPNDILTQLLVLALLGYTSIRIIKSLRNGLIPTINSILICLTIILLYLILARLESAYVFYGFTSISLSWLKFADVIVLSAVVSILDLRSYNKELRKDSRFSLIEDDPDPTKHEDQYGSQGYAAHIANHIKETTTNFSFAIGVFAEWGSGKTNFLLRLNTILKEDESNLIIDFNPWQVSDVNLMIDDLFKAIAKKLKPYNRSSSEKIKDYSKKIFQPAKEIHYRALDTMLGDFMKDESIIEKYQSINASIKQTGKRIIISIDDLDRLTGKEVLAVLRLMRNTASFANTVFVVALDHSYIASVLKKTDKLANEDQYLKKIFQLVITLPKIKKDTFGRELRKLLRIEMMGPLDKEIIDKTLTKISYDPETFTMHGLVTPRHESYLESMLKNMRDVKRFANSFKISFELLKDDVEVYDLCLLELLKTGYFDVFEKISTKELLSINSDSEYGINEDYFTHYAETKSSVWSKETQEDIHGLLSALLYPGKKNERKFCQPNNFYIYFSYQLFNLISLKEFIDVINGDADAMCKKFTEWSSTKFADLNKILDSYNEFKNAEEFKKFVYVYLKLADPTNYFISRVDSLLRDRIDFRRRYFEDDDEFMNYLRSLFNDKKIPVYNRGMIARGFLKDTIYLNQDVLTSKDEWQAIVYTLFDEYLSQNPTYDHYAYEFLLFNDDSRTTDNYVILNPKAHKRFESYITGTKENLEDYLKFFIRPYYQPFDGALAYEPFVFEIFGNKDHFLKILHDLESQDPTIKNIRRIILENIDSFTVVGKGFYVNDADTKFLFEHFKSTGQLLPQQKKLEKKFGE